VEENLPDREDDLQGFLNEEISKSKILDVVCYEKFQKNSNKETKNNCGVMHVKWASST
jgi:hypothetical protein